MNFRKRKERVKRVFNFKMCFTLFMNRIKEPGGLDKVRENYEEIRKYLLLKNPNEPLGLEFEERVEFLNNKENIKQLLGDDECELKSFMGVSDIYEEMFINQIEHTFYPNDPNDKLLDWIIFFKNVFKIRNLFKRSHLNDKYGKEKLQYLREIDVRENEIDWIQLKTFDGLWRLRELTISDTKITQIDGRQFESLSNLNELWLYNNRIALINSDSFKGLENLKLLSLENYQIFEIKDEALMIFQI